MEMVKVKLEAILESEKHVEISRVIVDINRIIKEFNVDSSISIQLILEPEAGKADHGESRPERVGDISVEAGTGIPGISTEGGMDSGGDGSRELQDGSDQAAGSWDYNSPELDWQ